MEKQLSKEEDILGDVDDELYLLKRRIQFKHNLNWIEARDAVNDSIARLCCDCWNEKKKYGCGIDKVTNIK